MEPEERKISVWICQEEKLISGLSRRTTCSDVVRVLLEDSQHRRRRPAQPEPGGGMLSGPPHSYCIVEKWRGFERILPNKTRILRLWVAWGDEQENVRFVLVRSEASLPNAGPRSAEARVVPSKERPGHGLGAARAGLALTQERQRRVVRKAFRKLAKINKKRQRAPAREASAAERMETLVHLVLSQDHTIRQQLQRLRELDREIDRYEAKIHLDRMKRHGVNYVQDTYLVGSGEAEASVPAAGRPEEEEEEGKEEKDYARRCEEVRRLQEQRAQQEELLEHLAAEIQEELNERWMKRRREELELAAGSGLSETDCDTTELSGGGELRLEHERVKTQLSTSLYIGLKLSTDLEAVKKDLDCTQRAREDKERELQRLLDTLGALAVGEEPRKDRADNDEDSDTGLSSMHSQDSDSVPVCESLV
ncbi:RASFA protein, partial [Ceuthmochares aereus]|nr:RASFA protein [Ceuthmochares aereus]